MKKTFFLYYETITDGKYTLRFTEMFAFMQAMEQAMDNQFVISSSYKIWTEEEA